MRTAIILVGNIRTWDQTKDSFIETFGYLNPDIFISTYRLRYGYHPSIQNMLGDNSDDNVTGKEFVNIFSNINMKGFVIKNYNRETSVDVHPQFKHLSSNCYEQYKTFNRGIYKMIEHENKNGFKYDTVIKTRFDIKYNPVKFVDLSDTIIIDSGNVLPNDCILITNRDDMVYMSDFMINEFFDPEYNDSHLNPPHGLLLNAIKKANLNICAQKIMNCVVRKSNYIQYY